MTSPSKSLDIEIKVEKSFPTSEENSIREGIENETVEEEELNEKVVKLEMKEEEEEEYDYDPKIYVAKFNFKAESQVEMSFEQGDEIEFVEEHEGGWCKGIHLKTQTAGWVPINYITKKRIKKKIEQAPPMVQVSTTLTNEDEEILKFMKESTDYHFGTMEPTLLNLSQECADVDSVTGTLKFGTLDKLVEKATSLTNFENNFLTDFMLTFRSFASSLELMTKLICRYNTPPPNGKKQTL
jgi:hypothetical protein